ncbi:MAG: hypothetical protein J7599_04975 [Niabella sp.]|nr:hypothetical protein [Niabella sp.]
MAPLNTGNCSGLNYPQFEYSFTDLEKFIEAAGIFTILLKNGKTVHYVPDQPQLFKRWLEAHNITDLKSN